MNSEKIIEAIVTELKTYGVRWYNGKDLGSVKKGSNVANMAVDFSETRLEVKVNKSSFEILFGNKKSTLDRLQRHPILGNFIIAKDGAVRLWFALYHKPEGKHSCYKIGNNQKDWFGNVTNYKYSDANEVSITNSNPNDFEYKSHYDEKTIKESIEIIKFFNNAFKSEDFYKEWEFNAEKVRQGLNQVKNI